MVQKASPSNTIVIHCGLRISYTISKLFSTSNLNI